MNSLKMNQFGVQKLNIQEILEIDGGTKCSFAYDVGFGIRLLFTPIHWIGYEIVVYDQTCN